ncbi:hypothetical protein HDV05_000527 [Chytridiales sp. JEL 0842]|nr:hypothetical protein HDV05_000527 [Chytridiales sp. JEL 0842]
MSQSEDIIRHIIRDISTHSTTILKSRQTSTQLAHLASEIQKTSISEDAHPHPGSSGSQDDASSKDSSLPPLPKPSTHPTVESTDAHPLHHAHQSSMGGGGGTPVEKAKDVQHLFNTQIQSHVPSYTVSETLAAFMVRAVVLDPRSEFRIERELTKVEVERLISMCVERITATNDPTMETVKMQVYFDTNFPAQSDYLHREKMSRLNATAQILRDITEVKQKNVGVYEELYRKVVSYILLRSHLGPATDMRVVRETTDGFCYDEDKFAAIAIQQGTDPPDIPVWRHDGPMFATAMRNALATPTLQTLEQQDRLKADRRQISNADAPPAHKFLEDALNKQFRIVLSDPGWNEYSLGTFTSPEELRHGCLPFDKNSFVTQGLSKKEFYNKCGTFRFALRRELAIKNHHPTVPDLQAQITSPKTLSFPEFRTHLRSVSNAFLPLLALAMTQRGNKFSQKRQKKKVQVEFAKRMLFETIDQPDDGGGGGVGGARGDGGDAAGGVEQSVFKQNEDCTSINFSRCLGEPAIADFAK